jgi:hypothetical protein
VSVASVAVSRLRAGRGILVDAGGVRASAGMAAAAAASLALALLAPLATTVVGLVLFGVVHNFFELRYVLGRFDRVLAGTLLRLLLAGITVIALLRITALGAASLQGEILVGFGLLALVLVRALRHQRWFAITGLVLVAGATGLSLTYVPYHFVVLAHLHNLVPLVFLWEWARASLPAGRDRTTFRVVQLLWVIAIPALLLLGAFDPLLGDIARSVPGFTVDPDAVSAAYTPPAWRTGPGPLRFLTAFAFLQTMHYAVWCWFLPRHAPTAVAQFEDRVAAGRLVAGRRFLIVAAVGAVFFGILFVGDYATGRSLYGAVASYHAYLEFPVLLALVLQRGTVWGDTT